MDKLEERDVDRLIRILDYCERIESCIQRFGDDYNIFAKDADYRDVIKMNLFQIGENVNGLSEYCRELMNTIPWHQIYGLRNIIGHGYDILNDERIWETVKKDIPKLVKQITHTLREAGEII